MEYYEKLRELREDNGLTRQDIADICNVSVSAVGHWETGRREMNTGAIVKLCRYYKVSANYLFNLPKDLPYPE
ncbi:MAG: helix-turn-helix domain-containing protein [Eubacterium sp.]